MALAVIKTGGKQYVVTPNKVIKVEKLAGEKGAEIIFDQVLLLSDDAGDKLELGAPTVAGKVVTAEVMVQGRARKIRVGKFKAKIRYAKVYGHRQPFTQVKIKSLGVEDVVEAKAKVEKAE